MSRAPLWPTALIALMLLCACGGGDPLPDVPTPGVDCAAHPELCA